MNQPLPQRRRASRPQSPSRRWMSIRVELVQGRGEALWPRPGRLFVAASVHTFGQLAEAIDGAFARWDLSHLHEFEMAQGVRIGPFDPDHPGRLDESREVLSRLGAAEQFVYSFDLGEDWAHLCTVVDHESQSATARPSAPRGPIPVFGWGDIPDQYGRSWAEDDGEAPRPPDPGLTDLPPLRPDWGIGGTSI
jgi:pRiA4b ORF-3-like protein